MYLPFLPCSQFSSMYKYNIVDSLASFVCIPSLPKQTNASFLQVKQTFEVALMICGITVATMSIFWLWILNMNCIFNEWLYYELLLHQLNINFEENLAQYWFSFWQNLFLGLGRGESANDWSTWIQAPRVLIKFANSFILISNSSHELLLHFLFTTHWK